MVRENRLFVGNPGTGKSTLINCLIGKNLSRAGINWGGGLTRGYQRFEHDDIAYMDTPGLADETILKEAAQAITKALKNSGTYKLFFMVRLQNGRIVSEDVATLNRVLDSIDAGDINFHYTVVMNCIGPAQYKTLIKRGDEYKTIKTLVNRRHLTDSFCFVPRIEALEEKSDHIVALPQEVYTYIDNDAPVIRIEKHQVRPIVIDDFVKMTHELQIEIEKLRTQQAALLALLALQPNPGAVPPSHSGYVALSIGTAAEPSQGENSTACSQRPFVATGIGFLVIGVSIVVFLWQQRLGA